MTLEVDPRRAEVARANLERAASAPPIHLRNAPALDLLPGVEADGLAPFDLFFNDADKESSAEYLRWALRLSRPGAVIVLDNVVRGGAVAGPNDPDPRVRSIRRTFDLLAAEPRLSGTAIQTVGAKGWDGFAVAVVES